MNFLHFIYTVFLFVVLTPAIFVRLPPKGNKWIVALVHGVVFATIYYLSHHFLFRRLEGLTNIDDIHDLSLNKHDVSGNLRHDVSGNKDKNIMNDIDIVSPYDSSNK